MNIRAAKRGVTHVTRNPQIQFGEPTIKGSRTTVASVVLAAQAGDGVDSIRDAYPHLTADDVADALIFYIQNRQEIDGIIERTVVD